MRHTKLFVLILLIAIIFSCIKFKELATLTTSNTSNLTINSVTSGGNITNGGSADITARGVCWSTSQNPAVSGSHTSDGTGTGSFTSNITGLTPGTKYYLRAYATNSVGTAYGNELSITTTALVAPTLTTITITEVSLTSAKSGGTILSDGGDPISAKGVCWSTSANPTVDSSKSSDGAGNATFVSALTGLTSGDTYYYRAYATNSVGTGYGNEFSFTTTCTAATATTNAATGLSTNAATLNGIINGNGSSTTVTFEYGTTTSYGSAVTATPGTITGSSNTSVSAAISSLTLNTTYHYRVDATNCGGTTNGADQIFTTGCTAATATTNAATGISTSAATLNGTINGNGSSTTVTFEYGTTTGYGSTISATLGTVAGSSNTSVSATISSLTSNATYHYRVKGVNCGGTSYGDDFPFTTTVTPTPPTVSTTAISGITQTTAASGGNVTSGGSSTVTSRGVCWSTTANPTTADSKTTDGSGTGSFSSSIIGLTANTIYHVRAYAVNAVGTAYGNDVSFESAHTIPTVTTTAVSNITNTTASSGGNVLLQGGENVTAKGVCWNTAGNPTITDSHTTDGTGLGSFTSNITGLSANTIYHVRAYAINAVGTAYGNDVSFESSHTIPTVTTMAVSNITNTTASSGGNVLLQGGENVTAKGVCWNTTGTPIITDSYTTDGTGLGSFTSNLTGLTPNTLYYVRAYATNIEGTAYGSQIQFTAQIDYTGQVGTVNDIDGNTYGTIGIGSQIWMAENLKTTKYNDNSSIPLVTDINQWGALSTPGYCWYNNDAATYKTTYGALYNWYTLDGASNGGKNVCPSGWHIPSNSEWNSLINYLGGQDIAGDKLKEVGLVHWWGGNTASNESGFTGLPGGFRNGNCQWLGEYGFWWSSTFVPTVFANNLELGYYYPNAYLSSINVGLGLSVRCLRNY